jgi:hypothetical protein
MKFITISLAVGIILSIAACNKKSALNISDDQIYAFVSCINGYSEIRKRGEDSREYEAWMLKSYGIEFVDKFQIFAKTVQRKIKSCPTNITVRDCAKSVNLNKQESSYYAIVEGVNIINKTKDLGTLKAETSLNCSNLSNSK